MGAKATDTVQEIIKMVSFSGGGNIGVVIEHDQSEVGDPSVAQDQGDMGDTSLGIVRITATGTLSFIAGSNAGPIPEIGNKGDVTITIFQLVNTSNGQGVVPADAAPVVMKDCVVLGCAGMHRDRSHRIYTLALRHTSRTGKMFNH